MFRILKFLFLLALIVIGVSWLINNNGEVVINWLGYEIVTDVFMIGALALFTLVFIFIFTYILIKIFSFKIGSTISRFFGRSDAKKLEKAKKDQEFAYEYLTKILACLDEHEVKMARKLYGKFCALVKNKEIIEYLDYRFRYFESDFYKASKKRDMFNTPGSSPGNTSGEDGYFTFAKDKGWTK